MQYQGIIWILYFYGAHGLLRNLEPYHVLNYGNSQVALIAKTIECSDARPTVDTCANDCFNKEKSGEQCIGFIGHGSGGCSLCQPIDTISSVFTNIINGESLYILQKQRKQPDVHIPLNGIPGQANFLSGKTSIITPDASHVLLEINGKENRSIQFQNGGNLGITLSEPECFCNFVNCPGTSISVSLWIKPLSFGFAQIITPEENEVQGLTIGKYSLWTCVWCYLDRG